MAIRLPDTVEITDWDEHRPCRFCDDPNAADPDQMDAWVAHLATYHGFKVIQDRPHAERTPRTIRLELAGWSPGAKFEPNARVNVLTLGMMHPLGYAGRRGTVVGWNAEASEYCVAFDEHPIFGWLPASVLEAYVPNRSPS